MFNNTLFYTDLYIDYYKYFILNKYWSLFIDKQITRDLYYKYNDYYINQILLFNILSLR